MKTVCIIPARYKSSRFPGKPLVDLLGKPMIWWVYQQCLKVRDFDEIYVATDDETIASVCKGYQMNAIMTPDCPTGSDRVAEAAKNLDCDVIINVQGDEPLIDPAMIQQVIDLFKDKSVYFGTLREKISEKELIESPNTVKIVTDSKNDAIYFSRSVIPSNIKEKTITPTYRHVGIYGYKSDFLQTFHNLPQSTLEIGEGIEPLRAIENGYKIRVGDTTYSSIGVDTPQDAEKVRKQLKRLTRE